MRRVRSSDKRSRNGAKAVGSATRRALEKEQVGIPEAARTVSAWQDGDRQAGEIERLGDWQVGENAKIMKLGNRKVCSTGRT